MSTRLNLLAPEVRANPYPFFAELRRRTPVCQVDPGGMWAVTRYDDAMAVLKSPQLFSSEGTKLAVQRPWLQYNPVTESIVMMDPPRHGRLRALVTRAFGPGMLSRMESRIRAICEELAQQVLALREVEFIGDFAMHLPTRVIGEMLGLDPALHGHFKRWVSDFYSISGTADDDLPRQAEIIASITEMKGYFEEVIERRRRAPGEDLVSELIRARVDGEGLTHEELMGFLFVLLVGGLETTIHLLGFSALTLMRHPELLARLRADPSLTPRFIEELLRYESPLQVVLRVTTDHVVLGGVSLPAGTPLMVLVGSANRDEARVSEPDRFDLDRTGHHHLPFGHGIHHCLGAPLARMEVRLALETLLPRIQGLSPRLGPVTWNMSLLTRGPSTVPLELHLATDGAAPTAGEAPRSA